MFIIFSYNYLVVKDKKKLLKLFVPDYLEIEQLGSSLLWKYYLDNKWISALGIGEYTSSTLSHLCLMESHKVGVISLILYPKKLRLTEF